MKHFFVIALVSVFLFACNTEEELVVPQSNTQGNELRSSGSCTCDDLTVIIEQSIQDPEDEACCNVEVKALFPSECSSSFLVVVKDRLTGAIIHVHSGGNIPEGYSTVLEWCPEGGQQPTSIQVEFFLNNERCALYKFAGSCEEPCNDCEVNLSVDSCEITACVGGRDCDINSLVGAYWTTPSGVIIPQLLTGGGVSIYNCYSVIADENGEYCFTLYDQEGCEVEKCIEVSCGCDPLFEVTENIPSHISVGCVNNKLITRINTSIEVCPNQCCEDFSGTKYVNFASTSELWNLTKNISVFSITGVNNYSGSGGCVTFGGDGADRTYLCPNLISPGDVLEGTWSFTLSGWEGCEPVPTTSFGGTIQYTVTAADLSPCCD